VPLTAVVGLAVVMMLPACGESPRRVSSTSAEFEPGLSDGFWSMPWPNDYRRLASEDGSLGRPSMAGYPNPSENVLLDKYFSLAESVLDGFGLNSPAFFAFERAIVLPEWSEESIHASSRCEGPVQIIDVDPESPTRGQCVPARWHVASGHNDPYLSAHQVLVAPYWGFPLQGSRTYAVVLSDITDLDGAYLQPPALLRQLLEGNGSDEALQRAYQPLTDLLQERAGEAVAEDDDERQPDLLQWIASATVFTTQDVTSEMQILADFIRADGQYPTWTGELELLSADHEEHQNEYELYDGSYLARNFQRGVRPYASEGGGFQFKDGRPVGMSEERIPLVISTPRPTQVQPEDGWPVIIHAHGTTGDRFSHVTGSNLRPGLLAANRGFLSVVIPQPFHDDRWPDGNSTLESLYSFNYLNPESGRTTFRQGALDTITAVEFVRRHMSAGGNLAEAHPQLRINPDQVYFVGHSQGGITGAIALPNTQGIRGWVLSGAGGGLSMTIMQREDPLVLRDTLLTALAAPEGTELFEMHPLVAIVQMLAEITDPINYAGDWLGDNGDPSSILLTEGLHDEQTPADTSEALAVAGSLPLLRSFQQRDVFGLELRGLEPLSTPYTGNNVHADGTEVTTGLAQFDDNHYAIFTDGHAALLWANFLYSQVRDSGPGELDGDFP